MLDSPKPPVRVVCIVVIMNFRKPRLVATGGLQNDIQLPSGRVGNIDNNVYRLQTQINWNSEVEFSPCARSVIDGQILCERTKSSVRLLSTAGPILGQRHCCTCIHCSESVLVRDGEPSSVHSPRRIIHIVLPRAMDEDILNITPSQIRIRLQNQSYHSGDKGRSTRGSPEVVGYVSSAVSACSSDIRCCNSLVVWSSTIGVCGYQNVCSGFRVP